MKSPAKIGNSPIHGKGVFAKQDILQGTEWTFELEKTCCESHCYVVGISRDGTAIYLGTYDWPYYINSDTDANLSLIIDGDNMQLIITAEQSIIKGEELTLPYDWTVHKDNCYELNSS